LTLTRGSQHLTFYVFTVHRRHVVRGGFGEEEGGGDRGHHAVRGAGEHLQGEVRGAVGGAQPQAAGRGEAVDVARSISALMRQRSRRRLHHA
jgi:hypothetical protein